MCILDGRISYTIQVDERVVMTVRQGTDVENAAILLIPGNAEGSGLFFLQEPFYPIIYRAVVDVVADFSLNNPTGEAVSMTDWLPIDSNG